MLLKVSSSYILAAVTMATDAANQRAETNNLPENPSENWYAYYRFKLGRDSPSEARNTLLVVATLIAAVTFQVGVNPPGGVWQDTSRNHTAGKSILASNKKAYTIFIFANSLAFASAVHVIYFLVIDCPFQIEVCIALGSMCFTYGASIGAVTTSEVVNPGYALIVCGTPFILRLSLQIIRRFKFLDALIR
uniref:PGG domain-containing protein n=1 Tax=Rhizophora mucronata TaxID=61149 RepID=A0A2P2MKS3_RHIMU